MGALRGLIWARRGSGEGHWECGNGPPDFTKCGEFLELISFSRRTPFREVKGIYSVD